MPKKHFSKPALSIDAQVELLQQRGLHIPDKERAKHYLQYMDSFFAMMPIAILALSFVIPVFLLVIPAQAGIHQSHRHAIAMDSRLRGNDGSVLLKGLL